MENVKYEKSYAVSNIQSLNDNVLYGLFCKTIPMLGKFKEQIKGESKNHNTSEKWQLSQLITYLKRNLCDFIKENEENEKKKKKGKKGKKEEKEEEEEEEENKEDKKNKPLALHYFIYKLLSSKNKKLPESGKITISDIASYFLIDKIDKNENFESLLQKEITKGSVASDESTTGMFNNITNSFELEKKLQHFIEKFTVFEYFNPPLDKSKLKSKYEEIVEYNKNIDENFKKKFKLMSEEEKNKIDKIANGKQRSSKLLFDLEYARSQLLDAIKENYDKYKNYNVKAISSKITELINMLENNPEIISNVYGLLNNLKRTIYIKEIASYYDQLKTMISSSSPEKGSKGSKDSKDSKGSIEWFVKYLESQEQSIYKTVDEILSNKKNEEIGEYIKKQISIIKEQIQNLGKIFQERENELKVLLYKIDDAFHLKSSKEFESEDSKKLKELFHKFFSKILSMKQDIANCENKENENSSIFFRLIKYFESKKEVKKQKDEKTAKIESEIDNIITNKKIDGLGGLMKNLPGNMNRIIDELVDKSTNDMNEIINEIMNEPINKNKTNLIKCGKEEKYRNYEFTKYDNCKFTSVLDYYKSLEKTLERLNYSFINESSIFQKKDFNALCNDMEAFFKNIEKYKWLDCEDSIKNLTKLNDVVFEFKYSTHLFTRNELTVKIYDID